MVFRIEPTNRDEDVVDFELVTNDGKLIEFSIPRPDCLEPDMVAKLRDVVEETEGKTRDEIDRATLKVMIPEHADTIDTLAYRPIGDIFKHWNESTEIPMGESEPSND